MLALKKYLVRISARIMTVLRFSYYFLVLTCKFCDISFKWATTTSLYPHFLSIIVLLYYSKLKDL
jgi:hypothetical protein